MDKVEHSWEWRARRDDRNTLRSTFRWGLRARRDDRNIAVLTKVEPDGQVERSRELRAPHGDRNEFRSTLCQQRAPRATRQTRTRVNIAENCYKSALFMYAPSARASRPLQIGRLPKLPLACIRPAHAEALRCSAWMRSTYRAHWIRLHLLPQAGILCDTADSGNGRRI